MAAEKARVHVMVNGRVKGVFFRAETCEAARRVGVTGWVCNTPDGRVEAVFEGDTADVDEMIQWCRMGSAAARVEHVEAENQEYRGEFESFSVRY